ncbi:hypothetical protein BXZ70DRAFT_940402 [Cristinia sonorae]|uniref:DUF6533 domain-containing protein n=1 Tax=Cristinia sonorae TaxID=1940300 RepID=A0A8K0UPT7_9AGAR|nr:hypothetical protein BXZ70DRAFT_940402 [Cristinia sonorae]
MSSPLIIEQQSRIFSQICSLVATAIVTYDYLLTFSSEVRFIWRRKINMATFIFVFTRYSILGFAIYRQWPVDEANISVEQCKRYSIASMVLTMLITFNIGFFTSFRAYAITGRWTLPVIAVVLCSMFSPAANIYNYARPFVFAIVTNGPFTRCIQMPTPEAMRRTPRIMPILVRSITILGDLLLLAVTWGKSYGVFKASLQLRNFKPKISVLLLRDGTLYFVALAALNLVVLLLVISNQYLHPNMGTAFIFVTETIACVLIARFILDLRYITGDPSARDGDVTTGMASEHGQGLSTIHFATSTFLGNLAAPLRATSDTSTGGDESDMWQVAKEPFMVGLESDHRDL